MVKAILSPPAATKPAYISLRDSAKVSSYYNVYRLINEVSLSQKRRLFVEKNPTRQLTRCETISQINGGRG